MNCRFLQKIDRILGTTRSEENADTWACCGHTLALILAYPEYDFLSRPRITKRKALVHHFSAFNCLRHKDEPGIEELDGYEPKKDLSRSSTRSQAHLTVKVLLASLTAMYGKCGPSAEHIIQNLVIKPFEEARDGERNEKQRKGARDKEGRSTADDLVRTCRIYLHL